MRVAAKTTPRIALRGSPVIATHSPDRPRAW